MEKQDKGESVRQDLKQALGRKARQIRAENMARVLLTIAKKPLSFSELLDKTGLSRSVLTSHLKRLEENRAIYRDTIKPGQTPNPKEVGKIVYKVEIDQVPEILSTSLSLIDILSGTLGLKGLSEELRKHKEEIVSAIVRYLNEHIKTREKALQWELRSLTEAKKREDSEG